VNFETKFNILEYSSTASFLLKNRFNRLKRKIRTLLPDALYDFIRLETKGSTES